MEPLKLITLTHADTKQPVMIVAKQVFSAYFSQAHKSIFVMATGGAIIPVSENLEEITNKLKGAQ